MFETFKALIEEKRAELNGPFASMLGQLDQQIETKAAELKAFDFDRPEMDIMPERQPMPTMWGALGAALLGPEAAMRFAEGARQVRRDNAEVEARFAQLNRDAVRHELGKKYGVDLEQFNEMLSLRTELMKMAFRAKFGFSGGDSIQQRAQWSALKSTLTSPRGAEVISEVMADPQSRGIASLFTGIDGDENPEGLRTALLGIHEAWMKTAVEQKDRSLAQGDERIQQGWANIGLAEAEDKTQAIGSVAELRKRYTEIDTALQEAKAKVKPEELDKPVSLKTQINGKERTTLRELLLLKGAVTSDIQARLRRFPELREMLGPLGSAAVEDMLRGLAPTTVPDTQPTPQVVPDSTGVDIKRLKDLIRGGL